MSGSSQGLKGAFDSMPGETKGDSKVGLGNASGCSEDFTSDYCSVHEITGICKCEWSTGRGVSGEGVVSPGISFEPTAIHYWKQYPEPVGLVFLESCCM